MKNKASENSIYKRLYRSKEYIDDCFSEPIDLGAIARQAYFSPYHFLRVFKKVYDKTPHRYLTERRIEKAKELLKKNDASVTQVCFDVGFQSLGSFSTVFNKHVGMSPAEFQKQHWRKVIMSIRFPQKTHPRLLHNQFHTIAIFEKHRISLIFKLPSKHKLKGSIIHDHKNVAYSDLSFGPGPSI